MMPQAVFERAKVIALSGDLNGSVNELRRFTQDPLRQSPAAPLAIVQLATSLRAQNKAAEAADVLARAREFHEARLQNDPERSGWIAVLRYHHGVALREAGKLPEARGAFDLVLKQAAGRPEAIDAALRLGQCLKDEGQLRLEAGRKTLAMAKKNEEKAHAQKLLDDGFRNVREAVAHFESQAEALKKNDAVQDVRARMLYEAAWWPSRKWNPRDPPSPRTSSRNSVRRRRNSRRRRSHWNKCPCSRSRKRRWACTAD
jgi:tetratricopeptide (TPR) repeat protein